MGFLSNDEKSYEEMEEEVEKRKLAAQIQEQKALEAEAKKRYGSDWKKFFAETKSGIDWQAIKFKIEP